MTAEKKEVVIYTDGSCLNNPGTGGYAAVLSYKGHEREVSGGCLETTNNQMELYACIAGLNKLKHPCVVDIYSDSQYVVKGITLWIEGWIKNNWINGTIKNIQLWKDLKAAVDRHENVRWHWVKGHSTNAMNNRVDELARQAAQAVEAGEMPPITVEA